MPIWSDLVELLKELLFALAQIYGGSLGLAIITLSLTLRLMLLPLTLRIAERAARRQRQLRELQPELAQLRQRYRANPARQAEELAKLYARHRYRPFDRRDLAGTLLQLPIVAALYSAIQQGLGAGGRWLWIRDLSQPDLPLALLVGALSYAVAALGYSGAEGSRALATLLPVAITLVFVARLASGVGLYWAASNVVGLVQALILRRRMR